MTTPEQALIAQAGPYMIAARARELIQNEVSKGCSDLVLQAPVALEPLFAPVAPPKAFTKTEKQPEFMYESAQRPEDMVRLQIWISPEQPFSWDCCELFLKHLLSVCHRVGFEIIGNREKIVLLLLCHRRDVPVVSTSFYSKLRQCRLSDFQDHRLSNLGFDSWKNIRFYDYFPSPPYSHLLTRPSELHVSTYEPIITVLANIKPPSIGMYQVMFQPVSSEHNWHRNIEILVDLEYVVKLVSNVGFTQQYAQQAPSGNLHQMAGDVESKAHNDKPFYAVAVRMAVVGPEVEENHIRSLAVFSNVFQHGGRPLNYLTENDYSSILNFDQIRQMFQLGLTYRPGFLVNSAELVGLVHVPASKIAEHIDETFSVLDPIALTNDALLEGTKIGTCMVAGAERPVCIPEDMRPRHTHLIGSPGTGKSELEKHMVIDDIEKGHGVAVLDPHGDLVQGLLYQVPEHALDRVIYFDPGDPDWVPLWNPLERVPGQDIGRMTDDLVGVLKSFVTGWGDRMENILRHTFFGLLHLSRSTLLDVSDLLRKGSKEGERIHKLMLEVIDNETARMFWQHDFNKYRSDELGPPKHKLSKLLVSGTVSLMLSQPNSAFNFHRIMDDGMIFLADLSKLGSEVREILGGFILAIMHITALGRSELPIEKRRAFHIYLDEAHRFVTDSLEDIIAETRKYGVSLTLAHQYLRQFPGHKIDALASVGTTVVFNVDSKDAAYLGKNFKKVVSVDDFIDLEVGQAIIRCGTEIVRIKTPKPMKRPEKHYRERIIAESRRKYCKPAPEVRKIIKQRHERANQPLSPLVPNASKSSGSDLTEGMMYDVF